LAKLASQFSSEIKISKGKRTANASSIASLLMLVAPKDTELIISARGKDEKKAVAAILELIAAGFQDGVDSPAVAKNPSTVGAPAVVSGMQKFDGIGVATGVLIGTAYVRLPGESDIPRYTLRANQVAREQKRFNEALEKVRKDLSDMCEKVANMQGATEMFPFMDLYRLLLDDPALSRETRNIIACERCNAEWAIKRRTNAVSAHFLTVQDSYLQERGKDIQHVMNRLLVALKPGRRKTAASVSGNILVTSELDPAHVIAIKHEGAVGFVCETGGSTSHTAILARSMNMPAIVGANGVLAAVENGNTLVLDMDNNAVIVNADKGALAHYRAERNRTAEAAPHKRIHRRRGAGVKTKDGDSILLQANIELPEETAGVLDAVADGVGLFRTEFLFLNRDEPPNEDEQFEVYRYVLKRLAPLPVVIRTIDIGLDKSTAGDQVDTNPLGLRAIRYCLAEPKIFLTQLRALLRAAVAGNMKILLPMLSHPAELEQTMVLIKNAREQLRMARRKQATELPIGGMIEVPASIYVMRAFARYLDFFSIGTNDLTQYTLAVDRSDERLARYYEHMHPAVIHFLANIVDNARRARKPVTLCGEMAGDPAMTRLLLSLGLTNLSMNVPQMAAVRDLIPRLNNKELTVHRRRFLSAATPEAAWAHNNKINGAST
jgi:phosphotransferase system enzyme I (PtsI)